MKVLIFFLTAFAVFADVGQVIRVSDGDTVTIQSYTKIRCRLYGIDAPEKKQPFGEEARVYLSQMVMNKVIHYNIINRDFYGRSVCIIYLEDNSNANEKMVEAGLAWAYVQYLKKNKQDLQHYLELQGAALQNKIGLWQDENPQAPWEFRKQVKKARRSK